MPRVRLLLCSLLVILFVPGAQAQRVAPYSYVSFAGGPQPDMRESGLKRFWTFESAGEAFVATPISMGQIELGASAHRYHARTESLPAFDAVLGYAGWDVGVRYPRGVRLAAGPRLGIYYMRFDVDTFRGSQSESEMAAGAHARLTVHPLPYVGLYAAVSYMRTFTHIPLEIHHVSAGAVLTLKSPRWLVKVLQ